MKKLCSSIFKILGIVVLTVLIAAIALYIFGTCRDRFEGADESLSSWMSLIDDNTQMNKIAIPGSHDAGTAGVVWLGATQTYSVAEQLSSGVRYFDLRVNKTDDSYVMFHSIFNGTEFITVLKEIRDFITEHPTEVLILDFQHFKGDSQSDVIKMLRESLYDIGAVVENTTAKPDVQFIRDLTLGEARGKCIIFWGDRSNDKLPWLFFRNDDECTQSGMCLDSYYIGDLHKSSSEKLISEAYPVYFAKLAERQSAGEDAMFVLQCQLTDGKLVFGPWLREKKHDPVISDYISELFNSDKLQSINIVMRDFITPDKCSQIIELNYSKGIIHNNG